MSGLSRSRNQDAGRHEEASSLWREYGDVLENAVDARLERILEKPDGVSAMLR